MEKEEFTRRWRRLKNATSDERRRFLAEELNKELGPFDAYKNRLPTIRGTPAFIEELPYMKANNINARLTYHAMFGSGASTSRNENSKLVNKIVEEMTNIPALIESFNPSSSNSLKTTENGISKRQNDHEYKSLKEQSTQNKTSSSHSTKNDHFSNDNSINQSHHHLTSKPSTSNDLTSKSKPIKLEQKSPLDSKPSSHKTQSPAVNKHKIDNSTDSHPIKQRRLESPQVLIPKIELAATPSPSNFRNRLSSDPNLLKLNRVHASASIKPELFVCKFPSYAIGKYVGYRIKKLSSNDKNLPDTVVSLNIRKMPKLLLAKSGLFPICEHVKECVKVAAKSKDRKKLDSTCALYLCGLMLYAVFKSDPSGVNALIREVLSILSTIRSTFLVDKSKHYNIASSLLNLVDSYLCERLYENTLELACKRRQLMQQCQPSFVPFESNEELVPENFKELIEDKDQNEILADLCSKDKVNIPKLYYQLLMENSQHAMLHERHLYTKRLAVQQMESLEPLLWKRLIIEMEFRLDQNSGTDIADSIFSLVYWMHSQENKQ